MFQDLRGYLLPPEAMQPISFLFIIPAMEGIMENGIELFLEPDVEINIWGVVLTINKTFNIGLK